MEVVISLKPEVEKITSYATVLREAIAAIYISELSIGPVNLKVAATRAELLSSWAPPVEVKRLG